MTLKNFGKVWCLDQCYPLSKINLSNENDMSKSTNWIKLIPMYVKDIVIKGDKTDHYLYLCQVLKTN